MQLAMRIGPAKRQKNVSLPGLFRQSTTIVGAIVAATAVMDARNRCGHDGLWDRDQT